MRTRLTQTMHIHTFDPKHSYESVRDEIDLGGQTVFIHTDHIESLTLEGAPTGHGQIIFRGRNGNPGQTFCSFYLADGAQAGFDNMTLLSQGDGIAVSRGIAWLYEVWIGQCRVGLHACGSQSLIRGVGRVTTLHETKSLLQFNAENGANIELACELVISGGPQWDAYVQADGGSIVDLTGARYTKAAEKGYSAAAYDFGVIRLDPKHKLTDVPGNGQMNSDRWDAHAA